MRRAKQRPRKRTTREVFAWGMAPEPREKLTSRLDKEWAAMNKRYFRYHRRRNIVGYARAFLGPHFFAGCYPGAEND